MTLLLHIHYFSTPSLLMEFGTREGKYALTLVGFTK